MDEDTQEELEKMREESVSGGGDRIEAEGQSSRKDFADLIADAMEDVEDDNITKTISVWDTNMAALLHVLDEDDARREEIAAALLDDLDRDEDASEMEKADIIRLALRSGLDGASPGILEEMREARNRQQEQKPV